MTDGELPGDRDRINAIIEEKNQRYRSRGGQVRFAGIEGSVLRIAPSGICWR